MFSVQMWFYFRRRGTSFVIGDCWIAKFGMGKNPIRTMLFAIIFMGILGATFTIREWPFCFITGMWLYMVITPLIEAAEQTIIQQVVCHMKSRDACLVLQALESAAAPLTAFLVALLQSFG